MTMATTKSERQEILRRYLAVFENTPKKVMAANLDIEERTLSRLICGQTSTPNEKTAQRMLELCERGAELAGLDDEALAKRAEELRQSREKHQLQFTLYTIEGLESKEIPIWFAHARDETIAKNYETAYKLLYGYTSTESEWESIPDKTKPYVLSTYGVCCYYTGRHEQSLESYMKASEIAGEASNSYFKKGLLNNIALSNMRLGNENEAFIYIEGTLEVDGGFRYGLFNALCVCSVFRNLPKLVHWMGRVYESAKRDFDLLDMQYLLEKVKTDKDLDWFRRQNVYEDFLRSLEELMASMERQIRKKSA